MKNNITGIAILLYVFVGISTKQICCGVGLACFLNVWPAIVQYKVMKLDSKQKVIQLIGYISFIVASVLMAYMAIKVYLPMLRGYEESLLMNADKFIEWVMTIVALISPIPIEAVITKCASIVIVLDVNTFHEEIEILKYQLAIPNRIVERNKYIVDDIARENDVNYELLLTILKLELIYRAIWSNRILEGVAVHWMKKRVIGWDYAIGICQMKISTVQKISRDNPMNFIDLLMKEDYSINVCGKYLKYLIH